MRTPFLMSPFPLMHHFAFAFSISMTTCSTVAALGMMPLCLYLYTLSWNLEQRLTIPYQNMGLYRARDVNAVIVRLTAMAVVCHGSPLHQVSKKPYRIDSFFPLLWHFLLLSYIYSCAVILTAKSYSMDSYQFHFLYFQD